MVRAVLEELGGDVHVVGLTATPPDELTTQEAELYEALLGPVDFQVPTPAVVRDGFLAPYQELAWLTEPPAGEQRWLDEHETRFRELVTELLDVDEDGPLDLGQWVVTRLRQRSRGDGDEIPWSDFQRRQPALAAAGVRFLGSAGLPLPPGAPRGEAYRRPPDLADWVVLLEDWVLRCLDARAGPGRRRAPRGGRGRAARPRLRADADGHPPRGVGRRPAAGRLGGEAARARRGPRRGGGIARRPTCARWCCATPSSRARAPTASCAASSIPTPARRAPRSARSRTTRGPPCCGRCSSPAAGCAAPRTTRPRCSPRSRGGRDEPGWTAAPSGDGLAELRGPGDWRPRRWVALATAAFEAGATRALVGTRAFLGEGWNAPCVNCLVDLTSAATGVSVRQMRGRSLRLDPEDPGKVASNWDIVCVAPRHAQGDADYERFVRKHRHLHAPADDGTLEAGVGHVHPDLSPFGPPPPERFAGDRPRDDGPRRGPRRRARPLADRRAVRGARGRDARPARPHAGAAARRRPPSARRRSRCRSGCGSAAAPRPPLAGLGGGRAPRRSRSPRSLPAAALAGVGAARARRAAARYPAAAPLDRIARAVCDAYAALGELRAEAAASLAFEPRASGYLRCLLRAATPEEAARVTAALDALLGPVERPRYLVSRLIAPPDPSALTACGSPPARAARWWRRGTRCRTTSAAARTARRPSRPRGAAGSGRRSWRLHPARRAGARGAGRRGRAGLELRHAAARGVAVVTPSRSRRRGRRRRRPGRR